MLFDQAEEEEEDCNYNDDDNYDSQAQPWTVVVVESLVVSWY
jgi:hypothetical protein